MNSMRFAEVLDYRFRDPELLQEALTHPSMVRDNKHGRSYERLEFLGDSVLGLVIAELLLEHYPQENEGGLAKRHASLVSGETVSRIARTLDLGSYLDMTAGERGSGGRNNAANLENSLEAVIAALYLDGGLEAAKGFILRHWRPVAEMMIEAPKDPKTTLQEWAQQRGKPIPEYVVLSTKGPSHAPMFTVEVRVQGAPVAQGSGTSKRLAEREAAKSLLERLY